MRRGVAVGVGAAGVGSIGIRAASCASRFVAKSFASAFQPEWIDQILRIAANPLATQTKSRSFNVMKTVIVALMFAAAKYGVYGNTFQTPISTNTARLLGKVTHQKMLISVRRDNNYHRMGS